MTASMQHTGMPVGGAQEPMPARLKALDMLYTTRLPVKTVAQRAGYQSVESFSRAFRERYGTDPSFTGNG